METDRSNYEFNNCTVTINEEGKGIHLLEQKLKQEEDKAKFIQETVTLFVKETVSFIKNYVEMQKSRKVNVDPPKPVKKSKTKTKKK